MSQAAPSDTEASIDASPYLSHPDPDSCQDVPEDLAVPAAPPQPPVTPESHVLPQSSEDKAAEDKAAEEVAAETSEGPTDQPEPLAEGQMVICDQPVSLEPEASEEDVEVCSTCLFLFCSALSDLHVWSFLSTASAYAADTPAVVETLKTYTDISHVSLCHICVSPGISAGEGERLGRLELMGKVSPEQRHLHSGCVLLFFFSCFVSLSSPSLALRFFTSASTLCAGQSLTSVKTKAGEALRLHKTSVGEEAQEEELGAVEEEAGREDGEGGGGEILLSSCEEATAGAAAPGRGVLSTITHAVQNTVSHSSY